jgi:rhamnosyltransferase
VGRIEPVTDVRVVVPVLNAMSGWPTFREALLANLREMGLPPSSVLIIDSASEDGTAAAAAASGFQVREIRRDEFDHGATRQLAADELPEAELLVYLTQDAILARPDSLRELVGAFADPEIGAAYGRQLPRAGATAIEAHARMFNYPATSRLRELESRRELGLKSIFLSNSFAAYRRAALVQAGGFSKRTIFGEDMVVAGRLHLQGWKTAYVATAVVYHSHAYSYRREFQRYFDIGVLHSRESWLLKEFGGASGEGLKFVMSETRTLWPASALAIPSAWLRTVLKYAGYRLGRREAWLSMRWKRRMSMNRAFWKTEAEASPPEFPEA